MKLIHVSDLHLVPEGVMLYSRDPERAFAACVDSIVAEDGDAAVCVFTGDIAHAGATEAYARFLRQVQRLPMPWLAVPGNHDEGGPMALGLGLERQDGFLNAFVDVMDWRLILLDTKAESGHQGEISQQSLIWLTARLAEAPGRPLLLFMHHPPFDTMLPYLDDHRFVGADALCECLRAGGADLRHIFFGHAHRSIAGNWRGWSCSTVPSVCQQYHLGFSDCHARGIDEEPSYAIAFAEPESVVVHTRFFRTSREPFRLGAGVEPVEPARSARL